MAIKRLSAPPYADETLSPSLFLPPRCLARLRAPFFCHVSLLSAALFHVSLMHGRLLSCALLFPFTCDPLLSCATPIQTHVRSFLVQCHIAFDRLPPCTVWSQVRPSVTICILTNPMLAVCHPVPCLSVLWLPVAIRRLRCRRCN